MTRTTAPALSVALACVLFTACQKEQAPSSAAGTPGNPVADAPAAPAAPPVDLELLAERLVANAAVKEGDGVLVTGRTQDAELLENIAVQVRRLGAFPMVEYASDRLGKRLFFDVPAQYDSQVNALDLKLAEAFDVVIALSNGTTENLLQDADPQRIAALSKAGEAVEKAFMAHGLRRVEVGNGLYPTPWRAERLGLSESELAGIFWNGVNVDYAQLQTRGAEVKAALAPGGELHVTHPNGTDFKVRLQGRPILISDGIITAEDIAQGGGALAVYLPAGEVYTTPVPGSGDGRIVSTRDFFRGQPIDNLTVELRNGKVTALSGGGPGFAGLKAQYDAIQDARKDLFAFVDFGINPHVRLPANSQISNWVPAGTVTLGVGGNAWAGGDNTVPYGAHFMLPGSTVTLDGKVLVEGGELKI